MKYRSKLNNGQSKKIFKKTVKKTNYKNIKPIVSRGGIRL